MTENTENTEKTLTDLEIVEAEIAKYITENGVTPFANINLGKEGNTIEVDMDQQFENTVKEKVTDFQEALGQYFQEIIRDLVEKIESGEVDLEELKGLEPENTED